jgi:hypothetical protein
LSLDFEEDGIHFVDVDHSFEDFVHVIKVKLNFFVEEVTLEIVCTVGGYVFEIALGQKLLSEGDFTVIEEGFLEE